MPSDSPQAIVRYAPTAGLVVWESDARWSSFWRRELGSTVPVRQVQQADATWEALPSLRHGVLAVVLSTNHAPQMISLLARVQQELPTVLCVVHLAAELAAWEMLVREAGAKFVIHTPWQLAAESSQIVRHLARAPQPSVPLREELAGRLPWPHAAVSSTFTTP